MKPAIIKCCLSAAWVLGVISVPKQVMAWEFLGIEGAEIATPTEVYIDWPSIEDLGDDQFRAQILRVHPHKMKGVDLFGPDGDHIYDLRFPYRSYVTVEIFDCAARMSALLRSTYYAGERPSRKGQVLDQTEDDPVFAGAFLGLSSETLVLDAVCAERSKQEEDSPRNLGAVADPSLGGFFTVTGALIDSTEESRGYYNIMTDRIHMPPIATFHRPGELGHLGA